MSQRPQGTAPFLPAAWWGLSLTRRRQVAGLATIVVLVVCASAWTLASGGDPTASGRTTAEAFVADLPADRVATWDRLAQCESSGNWSEDSGNGFFGGLQFTQQSWEAVGGTGSPADASRDEQIMRAEELYDEQGWGAWPACSRTLGLVS